MTASVERDVVIVACGVSAGIHAALTPDHFREGAGAGGGFFVATILLGALAVVLTRWPSEAALAAGVLVLTGLIVSYALVLTTGVPVLHPEVERLDGLALATKVVEAVGTLAALHLLRSPVRRLLPLKGTPA
jgi:hypothetical protein